MFKEVNTYALPPPELITTRCGTWIDTVSYYKDHFNKVKNIITKLNFSEATVIAKEQQQIYLVIFLTKRLI